MSRRILVVTSDVPFVEGGHMVIARAAVRALRDCGHEADLVTTPQNRFGRQFSAYLATRLTDVGRDGLGRPIDQVLSFRFPSFAVKHPRHVCWLNHRLREYYDLWPLLSSRLGFKGKIKEGGRRLAIHALDAYLLKHNVTKVFAQSETIRRRLQKWGGIAAEVLFPPPPQRAYRQEAPGDFIFTISRLQKLKRLDLLIDAFRFVENKDIKAVIIGDGPERNNLLAQIRRHDLGKRIILSNSIDEETILSSYARCLAVFFCPYQEDYGLVTPEAFSSGKPVITASDSGGPVELVKHGETGWIVEAEPKAIALIIDRLAADRGEAETMGRAALDFVSTMTWEKAVGKLLLP